MDWFRRNFIPHEENGYTPHVLQKAAIVGMLILVLISFSVANLQSIIWISSEWLVSTVLPAVVTEETNSARTLAQLAPLQRNSVLDHAAQMKAEDMARNSYFAHTSPNGATPWSWFEAAGYKYAHAGENLAVHFTDSSAVVEAWLNSPSHRANILNGNYREIGIGTAMGRYEGYDTVFVVQMFGAPAAVVAAAPAPVVETPEVIEEEVLPAGAPAVAGATEEEAQPVTTETPADEQVTVTDEGTVVYESFASVVDPLATPIEPAVIESDNNESSTFIGRVATSPRLLLQMIYMLIGLFVTGALLTAVLIEWRRRHAVQIAYSAGLLVVMVVLFQVHMAVSGGIIIA